MVRPPPLRLHDDNLNPGPLYDSFYSGRPLMRSGLPGRFFSRVCESDVRWLVTAVTVINFFRLSYSTLNAFHDADVDSSHGATKLGTVSITLGVVFFAACLIEIFGFVCAVMVRPFNTGNLAHINFERCVLAAACTYTSICESDIHIRRVVGGRRHYRRYRILCLRGLYH